MLGGFAVGKLTGPVRQVLLLTCWRSCIGYCWFFVSVFLLDIIAWAECNKSNSVIRSVVFATLSVLSTAGNWWFAWVRSVPAWDRTQDTGTALFAPCVGVTLVPMLICYPVT
jgi:hypothetical protein